MQRRAILSVFASIAAVPSVVLVAASCQVDSLDLTGKSCPCTTGYVCETTTDTCVPVGTRIESEAGPLPEAATPDGTASGDSSVKVPLVTVTGLAATWATPNTIRWQWTTTGDKAGFRSYQLRVGKSAAEVTTEGAPGVEIYNGQSRPELDLFDARGGKTAGPVTVFTTSDNHSAAQTKFAVVVATDMDGTQTLSNVAMMTTGAAAPVSKVIFDGATARKPDPIEFDFKAAGYHQLNVTCAPSPCPRRAALVDLGLVLTAGGEPFTAAIFDRAFLSITLQGNVAVTSFDSRLAIEPGTGANCPGGDAACLYGFVGFTQRRAGESTVQVPLRELVNGKGEKLTFGILQQKSFTIDVLALSGTWANNALLRLTSARIRW